MAQYRAASGDETADGVCLHRQSPYKFCGQRAHRHRRDALTATDWSCWTSFTRSAACRCPAVWRRCKESRAALIKTVEKQAMEQAVLDFLK